MASTYTPNHNLEKPADGDKVDAWGPVLRSNWDIIDAALGTLAGSDETPRLFFRIPRDINGDAVHVHFKICTDRALSSIVLEKEGKDAQTNWYYWDGSAPQSVPSGGVTSAFYRQPIWYEIQTAEKLTAGTAYYIGWRYHDGSQYTAWSISTLGAGSPGFGPVTDPLAEDIYLHDPAAFYTTQNVEAALEELGPLVAQISDVTANTTHRTSDGKDHSDVVLNNTHRASTANPHSVTAAQASAVADSGDETVAGIKTFSSFPITPSAAPTTDYQVANKKYVDDSGGGDTFYSAGQFIYNLVGVAIGPRTDTLGANASGTTLTLSGTNAFKWFQSAMAGNCYMSIWNATRSQLAWVSAAPTTSTLTVTVAGDISSWLSGDTVSTSYDGVSNYSKCDVSPIVPANSTFIQLGVGCTDTGVIVNSRGVYFNGGAGGSLIVRPQVQNLEITAFPILSITTDGKFEIWDRAVGTHSTAIVCHGYYK